MYTIDRSIRGNSNVAIAGRVERKIRRSNQWKVASGILSMKVLRKWAKAMRKVAMDDPVKFVHWGNVVRFPPNCEEFEEISES